MQNPTYKKVCSGTTGHAEAVEVVYDPSIAPYDSLVSAFFTKHDPTTLNRQGNDVGSQYRSAIFYTTDEQRTTAEKLKVVEQDKLGKTVVTEIVEAPTFWPAEEYHQQYLEKGGQCASKGCNDKIRCYG